MKRYQKVDPFRKIVSQMLHNVIAMICTGLLANIFIGIHGDVKGPKNDLLVVSALLNANMVRNSQCNPQIDF